MKKTNGILVVNKPEGYTSRDIVNKISKQLNTKKVGHTGTLDPLATGVLVTTIGRYTKLGEMLSSIDKEYIAEIKLGLSTDTLDITGNTIKTEDIPHLSISKINEVLKSFIGIYHMEVPIYSAIKVKGKKLYEYARSHEEVALPIKDVHIYSLLLLAYDDDIIKIKAHVSKGTYIRSLVRDICTRLGTIGTMNSLIRTKQGSFTLNDAYTLEDIESNNYQLLQAKDVLDIKTYNLNAQEYQLVKNGNGLSLPFTFEYLFLLYNEEEIAIYKKEADTYKCHIMFKIDTI